MKKLFYLLILWPAVVIGQLPINYSMDVKGFVKANAVTLDTTATAPAYKKGTMFWDNDNGTVSVYLGNGVTWQGGIENLKYVQNVTGTLIGMGKFVYIYSSGGETPRVALADNRYIYSSYTTIGITTSDISQGGFGWVCIAGEVHELTTTNEGQKFYLGTSGNITFTRPTNAHVISGGIVQYSHATHGILDVRIEQETYPQLEVLSNLAADGTILDTIRGFILKGRAKVWNDISIGGFNIPATSQAPSFTTGWAGSSALGAYYFQGTAQNDIGYFDLQIPHETAINDSLSIHVHGGPTTTPISTDTVVLRLTYSFAEVNGTFPTVSTETVKVPLTGKAQWSQSLVVLKAFATGTGNGISGIYNCSLQRLQDNVSDTYTGNWGMLSIDAHAKIDRLGSDLRMIK